MQDDSRYNGKFIFALSLSAFCMAVLVLLPYLAERRSRIRAAWPQTNGTPVSLRVVEVPANGKLTATYYAGECLVEYQVAGKAYRIWARAGIADRNKAYVADQLTVCPIARYIVHYNPKDLQDATASRSESSP